MSARNLLRVSMLAALLSPVSASPVWADGGRLCDPTDGTCAASGGCYSAAWLIWSPPPETEGYCEEEDPKVVGTIEKQFFNYDPPGTAQVVCEPIGDCRLSCTAVPFGTGFTYAWSRSGPVFLDSTPAPGDNVAIYRLLNNNAATVQVTATSPSGTSSPAAWGILPGGCFPN